MSSFTPFRSPEGLDSQPPALPPKQLSRKTLSQIIQAHSQQSLLDNHVNEMYDVPINADKTTVSHRKDELPKCQIKMLIEIKMPAVSYLYVGSSDTKLYNIWSNPVMIKFRCSGIKVCPESRPSPKCNHLFLFPMSTIPDNFVKIHSLNFELCSETDR